MSQKHIHFDDEDIFLFPHASLFAEMKAGQKGKSHKKPRNATTWDGTLTWTKAEIAALIFARRAAAQRVNTHCAAVNGHR